MFFLAVFFFRVFLVRAEHNPNPKKKSNWVVITAVELHASLAAWCPNPPGRSEPTTAEETSIKSQMGNGKSPRKRKKTWGTPVEGWFKSLLFPKKGTTLEPILHSIASKPNKKNCGKATASLPEWWVHGGLDIQNSTTIKAGKEKIINSIQQQVKCGSPCFGQGLPGINFW